MRRHRWKLACDDRLPVAAVQQPGQAVDAGERGERLVLTAHPAREVVSRKPDRDRISDEKRQGGEPLHGRRQGMQLETERHRHDGRRCRLRGEAARKKAQPANADRAHRHHREDHRARRGAETDQRHPRATACRVHHQVAQLGAIGIAAAASERIRDVRPDQRVREQGRPGRRVRALVPERAADAHRAQHESECTQNVHPPRETQAFVLRALRKVGRLDRLLHRQSRNVFWECDCKSGPGDSAAACTFLTAPREERAGA
jgi:hypothetical protein